MGSNVGGSFTSPSLPMMMMVMAPASLFLSLSPFLSTNLALFWAALQVAGVRESIPGYGVLLEKQPALKRVRLKD